MKGYRSYLVLLTLASVFFVITRATRERETDWTPSFIGSAKLPYGCFVLRDRLLELFPRSTIVESVHSPYTALPADADGQTLVIINESIDVDDLDRVALLDFASHGNTLFVAANDFSETLKDTLGIETASGWYYRADSARLFVVNPSLRFDGSFNYRPGTVDRYLREFDTTRGRVLATNGADHPVMIVMPWGRGQVIVSTVPYAYTNYSMLTGDNAQFAARTLSYAASKRIIWDEYYKVGRREVTTPMRYVWSEPALTSAFWIGMVGVALFVVFMGRRRQRIIPVVTAPANTTLEFVETVGRLYFHHGDHRDLAEKKASYFLEHARARYGVNTLRRDTDFMTVLAARSGVRLETVRSVMEAIDLLQSGQRTSIELLMAVNDAAERFYSEESTGTPNTYHA